MTKRVVIQLRVSEEEKAQVEAKAACLGVDVSTLIRRLVLGNQPKQVQQSAAAVWAVGLEQSVSASDVPKMCAACTRAKRVGNPVPEKCEDCGR